MRRRSYSPHPWLSRKYLLLSFQCYFCGHTSVFGRPRRSSFCFSAVCFFFLLKIRRSARNFFFFCSQARFSSGSPMFFQKWFFRMRDSFQAFYGCGSEEFSPCFLSCFSAHLSRNSGQISRTRKEKTSLPMLAIVPWLLSALFWSNIPYRYLTPRSWTRRVVLNLR